MRYLTLVSLLIISLFFWSSCKDDETIIGGEHAPPNEYNVLLIIADDMGKDACVGYTEGNKKGKMPNISKLVNSGMTFDNFWVHPLCTPTRSSILTGKFPSRNNMLVVGDKLATSEKSLHSYIHDEIPGKYASAIIGKWHLGSEIGHPEQMGVPHYSGLLSGAVQSYSNWNWTHDGITETSTEYTTTKFTDMAIDWLDKQDQPWFLWLAYNAPHTPFHLPPLDLHDYDALPTDQASIDADPLSYYVAMVDAMDTEIGRLLNSLSEDERNKTVIIFIGDNGTPNQVAQSPYSRTKAKNSLYLGGINTPMIVSGPGIDAGTRNSSFVQSTDLFMTIANLMGIEVSEMNDSKSFIGDLYQPNGKQRSYLYSEIGDTRAGHTIRNDSFHLIKFDSGNELFFNLMDDPTESNDLLKSTLSSAASVNKTELENELNSIRK